jgi:nucleoid-associated protein YgaU
MSDSHDPVKDALKHLFGKDKDNQAAEPDTAGEAATQAAAQAATPATPAPSHDFSINAPPAEQAPAEAAPIPSHDFSINAPPVDTAPSASDQHESLENRQPAYQAAAEPAPASNPDVEQINGHAVGFAFLRYYKEHPEIGQPVDEQHGNVGGYQMFENAILHWDGSAVQVEKRGGSSQGGGGQRTYTVNPGDNLSAIAQHLYGDASQWRRIYEANRDKISNPDLIHPGQVLNIP